jgi:hypothetical protein
MTATPCHLPSKISLQLHRYRFNYLKCIDLQVKYGNVCSLWYDAAGSSGIMGLTFSSSTHVTKVRCVFISLKS